MDSGTWQPDWPFRVYERINTFGFHSLVEMLDSRPLVSLLDLARELGPGVAAVQLESLWLREAREPEQVDRLLCSLLIRRIRSTIPAGWSDGEDFAFNLASGYASWGCIADVVLPQSEQTHLWEFLRGLSPEPGWLPTVPHDQLTTELMRELEQALDRARDAEPDSPGALPREP